METWLQSLGPLGAATVLTATEVAADFAAKQGKYPVITYAGYNALAFELNAVFKNNGIGLTNAYW